MDRPFLDRREAGRRLAAELTRFQPSFPLILALPRGGVPVAYEVAEQLDAPLEIFVVRKLGVPGQPELAMGALTSGGMLVLNREVLEFMHIPAAILEDAAQREASEVVRRDALYRGGQPLPDLAGRTVLLIDDGLATGASMRAALSAVSQLRPARLVAAIPIAAPAAYRQLQPWAHEVVCAETPEPFRAEGLWYRDFRQVTDDEVLCLLRANRMRMLAGCARSA
jgi:predicted phosphoribosyltransferase